MKLLKMPYRDWNDVYYNNRFSHECRVQLDGKVIWRVSNMEIIMN